MYQPLALQRVPPGPWGLVTVADLANSLSLLKLLPRPHHFFFLLVGGSASVRPTGVELTLLEVVMQLVEEAAGEFGEVAGEFEGEKWLLQLQLQLL